MRTEGCFQCPWQRLSLTGSTAALKNVILQKAGRGIDIRRPAFSFSIGSAGSFLAPAHKQANPSTFPYGQRMDGRLSVPPVFRFRTTRHLKYGSAKAKKRRAAGAIFSSSGAAMPMDTTCGGSMGRTLTLPSQPWACSSFVSVTPSPASTMA